MNDFFSKLGRKLGRASVPMVRQSKWLWQSLTGDEADSIQAETEFGQALAGELRARLGVVEDPEKTDWVAAIGRRLAASVPNKLWKFRVDLVRADQPMAMALPGGFIMVGDSFLPFCQQQPDEMAFIVGHEMAHVIRRHAVKRIVRNVGVEVVSTVLSRGALSLWLRRSGLQLLQSAHSQDTELEADEWGVRLSAAAGYDPRGALRLLQRLETLRQTPEGVGEYFASHPPETARITHLRSL